MSATDTGCPTTDADVLVVVVSYNNRELTQRAVAALRRQTMPVHVVVWDNNSQDGTQEWLRQQSDIDVELSPENVYWTPAINRAIDKYWAGETYVGYMNNDAAPLMHCVQRMVRLARKDGIGLVAPSMERIGGPQDIANCEGHDIVREGGFLEQNMEGLPGKRVTYVLGAFAILRKKVWDEVGPLDEEMPLGADDHDYCIRLKERDYQIWVAQDAFCQHAGHASARVPGASAAWDDIGARSWARFNEKWAGYYKTEEEAIKSHWGGTYHPGWER